MKLQLTHGLLKQIQAHGEAAYPEEGAGFLLGRERENERFAELVLPAKNSREDDARSHRYQISPEEMVAAEELAEEKELNVIAVFHSHPDHPERPSEFDREWALPWFIYVITGVNNKRAESTRAWQLSEDRETFHEVQVLIKEENSS
jgi:proteasome lid subunit RPN8/RPN11